MAATLAQFEWLIIEFAVLGLLIWQLVSIRRAVRRDREAAAAEKARALAGTRSGQGP